MGTFVLDLLILCEKVKGYYSIQIRFFLKNKKKLQNNIKMFTTKSKSKSKQKWWKCNVMFAINRENLKTLKY